MANVRPSLRKEILRELDNTPFGKDLFAVHIQRDDFLVHIAYLPSSDFTFGMKELDESPGSRYYFVTYEAPGQWMLENEEFKHENFSQARQRIQYWVRRIEEDYRATEPDFEDDFEGMRNEILKEFGASGAPVGERFSPEERDKMDE